MQTEEKARGKKSIATVFLPINNIFLFNTIQFCGSVFLLVLGILFLRDTEQKLSIQDKQKSVNSFMQGFAISILNPKILIWFAAIFSQFIEISSNNFIF